MTGGQEPELPRPSKWLGALVAPFDRVFDRIYSSKWSPLYQSGNLAVLFLAIATITGIYLFLFYKVGSPHESVDAIENSVFLGSFIRSLHRYSADLALVALIVHLVRKLVHGHTWGPRALAWRSGLILLFIVLLCGWTGLIMVWDLQGLRLAIEGASMVDLLPFFSEPISRSFSGEIEVPSSFFFMNLFLHVALPLGVAAGLWVHVARVARPALLPPRAMWIYCLVALSAFALLVPVALPEPADLLAMPSRTPIDLFYSFWLVPAESLSSMGLLVAWILGFGILWFLPWMWRPQSGISIKTSSVDEGRCTGCYQCYQDCPYEAISMVNRPVASSLSDVVARVDSDICVACGICSASCAPMGVGPTDRTGRDQLETVRHFIDEATPDSESVVLMGCRHGLGVDPRLLEVGKVIPYSTECSGSVHTSVIELLIREGAGGVYLLSCPSRDCLNREGPKWLHQRVYEDREAELQSRVDRRRIRVGGFSRSEVNLAKSDLAAFASEVAELELDHEVEASSMTFECGSEERETTGVG